MNLRVLSSDLIHTSPLCLPTLFALNETSMTRLMPAAIDPGVACKDRGGFGIGKANRVGVGVRFERSSFPCTDSPQSTSPKSMLDGESVISVVSSLRLLGSLK